MRSSIKYLALVLTAGALACTGHAADKPKKENKQPPLKHGVAVLLPTKDYKATGILKLTQTKEGVKITGEVTGLEPGMHGFHIHEFGDVSDPTGAAAGGHFNPTGMKHGGPEDEERHEGDLGNIEADASGVAKVDVLAHDLKLRTVLGRSFVVHAKADDLKSQPAGDAGPRAAVGIIGVAQGKMKDKGTAGK